MPLCLSSVLARGFPRFGLLLALLLAASGARGQAADSLASADSTVIADTLAGARFVQGDTLVLVLSDSARTDLDSAAVASLGDTTTVLSSSIVAESVPVTLFGSELFRIWGSLGDFTPEARAERLSLRLESFARNRDLDPTTMRVVDGNELTVIEIGELILMSVTDEDAAGRGMTRQEVAAAYAEEIERAVVQYREQATVRGFVRSALISLGLLAVFLLLLRGLGYVYAWLDRRTAVARGYLVRPIRIGSVEVIGRNQVSQFGRSVAKVARLSVLLVLLYFLLTTVFGLFPWTQEWSEQLLQYALSPLRQLGALIIEGAPNVLAIAVIVVVMRWVIGVSDYLFRQVESGEAHVTGFHDELAEPTRKIAKFLLVILSIMLIYPYTPIAESKVFQGLTVFLGILFSLGSSTAIANVVAGVVLTYTRAFRIGDRVKVGDTFGDVVEKTFLVTRIRTPKNEDVAVPNASVLGNHIVNYSRMSREGEGVILHTSITIGYDVPWPQVHDLLLGAARGTDGLLSDPAPFVLQTSLGDFSVAYELNAYTHEVTRMARLYSEMHRRIQDAFAEAGVEILSPTYHARRDAPSTVPDAALLRAGMGPTEASGDGAPTRPAAPGSPSETGL
ncbi:mechanosensitive ion channel family protein [Rubricoccus marinus]|uniref:Mechanosensitive ion channel protein MscS n=1 Tax=Rubricoccus marinus TaxID=716817 RepID=A0A259U0Y9_9BACT|nr:mechanosensitive ion channel family protein [Rubricoccus marinus]OZC03517.1 hypothetical protein BSZ36_11305 [Rubricoccus marinus]